LPILAPDLLGELALAKTEFKTIASKTIQHPIVTIDSNARLLILILPIDVRSFIVRVLNDFCRSSGGRHAGARPDRKRAGRKTQETAWQVRRATRMVLVSEISMRAASLKTSLKPPSLTFNEQSRRAELSSPDGFAGVLPDVGQCPVR
jgi:hypothetical protein